MRPIKINGVAARSVQQCVYWDVEALSRDVEEAIIDPSESFVHDASGALPGTPIKIAIDLFVLPRIAS
jgi:hypothetical protein